MELWDIYDKKKTNRTHDETKRLALKRRRISSDSAWRCGKKKKALSDHKACDDKSMGTWLVGSIRRCSTGRKLLTMPFCVK